MARTRKIARLTTGWALGPYPSKKLKSKAITAGNCPPSPPHLDPESASYPSKKLKTKASKARKCHPSPPHFEDPESAYEEDDADDICSPTKSGDNANSTVEFLEVRIPEPEEHTEPVDNTDADTESNEELSGNDSSQAESNEEFSDSDSSLAESNEELSESDSSQAESNEKFSDDKYLPSMPARKVLSISVQVPRSSGPRRSTLRKKKENGLVGLGLSSGHGGRQKRVRKKQIIKSDTIRRQNCIINDSDSVKLTASLSMAEPVSTWCQPQAKLPSHPIIENFLRGPQERFICRDFKSYADARTFAEKHFQIGSFQNGYSAVGTADRDPRAFIEIQKTRCASEIEMEHGTTVRDEVSELRRRIPTRAKAVSGTSVPQHASPVNLS